MQLIVQLMQISWRNSALISLPCYAAISIITLAFTFYYEDLFSVIQKI